MRIISIYVLALILAGCGSENPAPKSGSSDISNSSKTAKAKSSLKPASASSLNQTPISTPDALGLNKFMAEPGPCPFLDDETIIASVKSNFEFTRREVSNTNCRWAYNAGFSMEVTIENLVEAKPISDRNYNVGVNSVMAPQDGPGTNAAILNDTAWDKPLPYAYSFEKDGKLVFIKYTGVHTRVDKMREVAEEVANRMTNAKPIEHERREETSPFKPCETWTTLEILSAFGFADDSTVRSSAGSGLTSCQWKIRETDTPEERMLSISFVKTEGDNPLKLKGYKEKIEGSVAYNIKTQESEFGHYVKIITYIDGGYLEMTLLNENTPLPDVAKVLNANVIGRLTP